MARLVILYGSQTGNAQDVAEQIYRRAVRNRMNVCLHGMDDFPPNRLLSEASLLVCVCSTTGQGEEPDNMRTFWKLLLKRSLPGDLLNHIVFGVLGLGDSTYPKFNFVAKRMHRRLSQLGARPLCDPGLADDQHELGSEGVAGPWTETLFSELRNLVEKSSPGPPISDDVLLPSKYITTFGKHQKSYEATKDDEWVPLFAPVLKNTRVTSANHWQDVRLITFDISSFGDVGWNPGDVLYVQPSNFTEDVETLCELLDLDPNEGIELCEREMEARLPPHWIVNARTSVRECAEKLWDLRALPRRYFFELLRQVTPSEMERERLAELLDPMNQQDLWNYCHRPKRTSLETLRDFPSAAKALPREYLFDLFTPIKPRAFSIASSHGFDSSKLEILVAVVEFKTKMHAPRKGLCSNFLSLAETGCKVPVWVRRGTFSFPQEVGKPAILIGPGTGVAPFRALMQELFSSSTKPPKPFVLYFGCRNRANDYFFENEWKSFEDAGFLQCFVAFSRDQNVKVYVQNKIVENSTAVWELINTDLASVFLAGNAKQMPTDVHDALITVFRKEGKMNEDEADDYFQQLESSGRFQQETWA
ncbi:unnamed protein product [Notodromas monacha]|uniref:NADPH-dependent diflavin oxidoreductase 1 n=1 Tax=Notodromas monacha TaxID=399045 RepID=A0A7R9BDC9_9CRUS|nr:unnamed protein product [Notodromas monacha]CAG0913295.1 unnamed protein product [Notodromas monacha]